MPSSTLRPPASAASKRAANLHLSGLPRFHPANYPTASRPISSSGLPSSSASVSSSSATSPPSDPVSPAAQSTTTSTAGAPQRPQFHSRQFSDAQRKLHAYQREAMTRNYYSTSVGSANARPQTPGSPYTGDMREPSRSPLSPRSPHLQPLGSPGPVTPLELEEEQDGYPFSGNASQKRLSEEEKDQILETYMQKEGLFLRSGGPGSKASQARMQQYAGTSPGLRRGDPASHRSVLSR